MISLVDFTLADEPDHESFRVRVVRAVRNVDGKAVFIKLLSDPYPTTELRARFVREYEILANINSEYVVKAYDVGLHINSPFLVIEDFGGYDLSRAEIPRAKIPTVMAKAAEALGQIHHANVIHRDISPSNMVWNRETSQFKLIDFCTAQLVSHKVPAFVPTRSVEGTLSYISPEATGRMNRSIDYRTDFYSLGASFYELLVGSPPFETNDPMEMIHSHLTKTPVAPHERDSTISPVLSAIVMKLLAKIPEDRYQSAFGLRSDLDHVLAKQDVARRSHKHFIPGKNDLPHQFHIPQRLYGREQEVALIRNVAERSNAGLVQFVLVSGRSGVGKTSIINEVHRALVRTQGYVATGKFDHLNRATPYSAITQAFSQLMQQFLAESEKEFQFLKQRITKALGAQLALLSDIAPDTALLLPEGLSTKHAVSANPELLLTFAVQKFIGAVAGPGRPLVFFLDDLQWADAASLRIILSLIDAPKVHGFLFIGAYRSDEVTDSAALQQFIEQARHTTNVLQEIELELLTLSDVQQLVGDTLRSNDDDSLKLANLIYDRTHGHPLFARQLFTSLYEDSLIRFDPQRGRWHCDWLQISSSRIPDTLADLMAKGLAELAPSTVRVLEVASCIANKFELGVLSKVLGKPVREIALLLWEAISKGFVEPAEDISHIFEVLETQVLTAKRGTVNQFDHVGNYEELIASATLRFSHDRLQEAVYSQLTDETRIELHRSIGQELLKKHRTLDTLDAAIFEVANHLNLGRSGDETLAKKLDMARVNLVAGQRAIKSGASQRAVPYLNSAVEVFPADVWNVEYELALATYSARAEARYLCGDFCLFEEDAADVQKHARELLDRIPVENLRIGALMAAGNHVSAVKHGLTLLNSLGLHLPSRASRWSALYEVLRLKLALTRLDERQLLEYPANTDPTFAEASKLLQTVGIVAYRVNKYLFTVVGMRGTRTALKYGIATETPFGLASYCMNLAAVLGQYDEAYRLGRIAQVLADRPENFANKSRTDFMFEIMIRHWKEPVSSTLDPLLNAHFLAIETGDTPMALITIFHYCLNSFFGSKSITQLLSEIDGYEEVLRPFGQQTHMNYMALLRRLSVFLNDSNSSIGALKSKTVNDEEQLSAFVAQQDFTGVFWFHVMELVTAYLWRDTRRAKQHAEVAEKYIDAAHGTYAVPWFTFYDTLWRLTALETATKQESRALWRKIRHNKRRVRRWAEVCPDNHRHKYDLVCAEISRVKSEFEKAYLLYGRAIDGARKQGFICEAALANELAARCYSAAGRTTAAHGYWKEAHYLWSQWGAAAKVSDIGDEKWGSLVTKPVSDAVGASRLGPMAITVTQHSTDIGLGSLDLHSLMRASQSISQEVVVERVLKQVLKIVIQNAGADRGLLMLGDAQSLCVKAEATIEDVDVRIVGDDAAYDLEQLCWPVALYVARKMTSVLLDDAAREGPYVDDPYIQRRNVKSMLCAPLVNRGELSGIIYLENNATTNAFTTERVSVVTLLAAQCAIAVDNAQLYEGLEQKVEQRTSELKKAYEELRGAQKRLVANAHEAGRADVAAMTLHNVGNLLTSLMISCNLMRETTSRSHHAERLGKANNLLRDNWDQIDTFITSDPKGKKLLEYYLKLEHRLLEEQHAIANHASRLYGLVEKMSIEVASQQKYATGRKLAELCDIAELVKDVVAARLSEIEEKGIVFRCKCDRSDVTVHVQKNKLLHVVQNLLDNAVDAVLACSREEKTITVVVSKDEERVVIKVIDNGYGIASADLARIFQYGMTTKADAHGVGLHISANLVTEMGGNIFAESDGIGHGACFVVRI